MTKKRKIEKSTPKGPLRGKTIQFDVVTALPGLIAGYFNGGMMKKALDKKIIKVTEHNLHDYSSNKYGSVDDRPYGGGAGMVLGVEPIYKALQKIKKTKNRKNKKTRTILFSASGKQLKQQDLVRLAKYDQIIMICGRYEGVDERVKEFIDEEISIGDYVLTGGEIPALVLIDGVTRLIPGVLGNNASAIEESHSVEGVLEFPQYTKPEGFKYQITGDASRRVKKQTNSKSQINKQTSKQAIKTLKVPEVLLSGNHALIKKWREENRK